MLGMLDIPWDPGTRSDWFILECLYPKIWPLSLVRLPDFLLFWDVLWPGCLDISKSGNGRHLGLCRARGSFKSFHLPYCNKSNVMYVSFFVFSVTGGKTNQLILQNTATKAIIQGLIPDQSYALQIIAFSDDKESKPAQGQFRSRYLLYLMCRVYQLFSVTYETIASSDIKPDNRKPVSSVM